MSRWHATIYYRTEVGIPLNVEHDIEELEELQDIVERGPDWNTIIKIEVWLTIKTHPDMTLEKAQ